MSYFLSMKIDDSNNGIPIMSETSEDLVELIEQVVESVYELFTRRKMQYPSVIDNNFDTKCMSDAAIDLINGKIVDFEWKFLDKYDRIVRCYITSNI